MIIKQKFNSVSSTLVDDCIVRIHLYLCDRYGYQRADVDIDPLLWYIRTGRASTQSLGLLVQKKTYMLARKLHEGGSHMEAIDRIKKYIGYENDPLN